MAKGIIVVEMPKKCEDCPFAKYITINDRFCNVTGKFVYTEQMFRRPDWCPIHPMPERRTDKAYTEPEYYRDEGWNDCVDYLEGRNGK